MFHFFCFAVDEIFRLQGFPPKIIGYVFQIIFYSLSGSLFSLFFLAPVFFYKLLLMRQRFDSWQTFFEVTVKKKKAK